MRLKLFEAMEEEVMGYHAPRPWIKGLQVQQSPAYSDDAESLRMKRKVAVDYRIRVGSRRITDDTPEGVAQGKRLVAESIAQHMYGDITLELHDLLDWASDQGIGRDLENRIERLISLTRGHDVQ